MTLAEILEQAKKLSAEEQALLLEQLRAWRSEPVATPKTGAEIVAMLQAMDAPIDLVDPDIEDPVEWLKAQRRKRQARHKLDRDT